MKNIKLEELLNALPKSAKHRKNDLRKCQSVQDLKEMMLIYWFQTTWLGDIYQELCAEDTTDYKATLPKSEKIDIIFNFLNITDLKESNQKLKTFTEMPIDREEEAVKHSLLNVLTHRLTEEDMYHEELGEKNYHSAKSVPIHQEQNHENFTTQSPPTTPHTPKESQVSEMMQESQDTTAPLTLKKVCQFISAYPEKLFHDKDHDIEDFEVEIMEGMPIKVNFYLIRIFPLLWISWYS